MQTAPKNHEKTKTVSKLAGKSEIINFTALLDKTGVTELTELGIKQLAFVVELLYNTNTVKIDACFYRAG